MEFSKLIRVTNILYLYIDEEGGLCGNIWLLLYVDLLMRFGT